MSRRVAVSACLLLGLLGLMGPAAAQAPAGLRGKSVVASWTEQRTQRRGAEQQLRQVGVGVSLRVYVSDAGRAFSRMDRTLGGGQSASRERAPGESLTDGAGATRFAGRQLLIDSKYRSGARRIAVQFNDSFSSCSLSIIQGQEGGNMRMRSSVTGDKLEVVSIQTVSPTCSIRAGNVFGR